MRILARVGQGARGCGGGHQRTCGMSAEEGGTTATSRARRWMRGGVGSSEPLGKYGACCANPGTEAVAGKKARFVYEIGIQTLGL